MIEYNEKGYYYEVFSLKNNKVLKKAVDIIDKCLTPHIMTSVILVYATMLASPLGFFDWFYTIIFNISIYSLYCLLWRIFVKKQRIKLNLHSKLYLLMMLFEFIGIAFHFDVQSVLCVCVDFSYFMLLLLFDEENFKKDIFIFLISIIIYDILCVVSATFGSYTFLGFSQGYNSSAKVLDGISANSNQLGMLNLSALSGALYILIKEKQLSKAEKIFYIISTIICVLFIYLSYSRGSIISLIFAVFMYLYLMPLWKATDIKKGKRIFYILTVILVIVVSCIVITEFLYAKNGKSFFLSTASHIKSVSNKNKYSFVFDEYETLIERLLSGKLFSGRSKYWIYGFDLFKQKPLFGIGQGNLTNEIVTQFHTTEDKLWYYMHNTYLQVLVAHGLFALIAFIAFIVCVIHIGIKRLKKERSQSVAFILSSIFAFMLLGMIEITLSVEMRGIATLFYMFSAIIAKEKENTDNAG